MEKSERLSRPMGKPGAYEEVWSLYRHIGDDLFLATIVNVPKKDSTFEEVITLVRLPEYEVLPCERFNDGPIRAAFSGGLAGFKGRMPCDDAEHQAIFAAFMAVRRAAERYAA